MSHGSPSSITLPPLRPGPHQSRLATIAFVATFGGLLFGYDTGVINGALDPMREDLGLTVFTEGLVTATLLVGAAVGALIGGRLNDAMGRKKALIIVALVFFVGTVGNVIAPNLAVMLPSRFILGFAVGAASVTVPVYLAELAPTEKRGTLAGRNELAIVIGVLLAFTINAIIAGLFGHHDAVWRYMLAVCAIPAIVLFFGMLRMPESPRWLLSHGRREEALTVLKQVRNEDRAEAEMAEVEQLAEEEAQAQSGGWTDLAVPWIRRIIVVGIGLAVAQQLTGINSIMYYGTQLLREAGFSADAAIVANIANGVLAVAGTVVCLFWIIDRVSRRRLLIFGFCATTTIHGLITLAALMLPEGLTRAYVILGLSVTFVFFMQCCLNAPVWVCLSELFPLRLRGFGMGISVLCMWLMNAALTFSFPIIVEFFGLQGMFGLFFVVGALAALFLWRMLPNTSGRSLEELEESFAAGDFRCRIGPPSAGPPPCRRRRCRPPRIDGAGGIVTITAKRRYPSRYPEHCVVTSAAVHHRLRSVNTGKGKECTCTGGDLR